MKKSTGKVQPKKETVRITLPPKPSAAPTIKLPTLPPGGPTGAPGGIPAPAPAAPRPPAGSPAPVASQRTTTAAPLAPASAQQAAARPAPAAPRPAAAVAAVSPLDTILAFAACITGVAAIGTTIWMMVMLNQAING
jgi:hypothetical protein